MTIHGMTGVGKSTIARTIQHQINKIICSDQCIGYGLLDLDDYINQQLSDADKKHRLLERVLAYATTLGRKLHDDILDYLGQSDVSLDQLLNIQTKEVGGGDDVFEIIEHICCAAVMQLVRPHIISLGGRTIINPNNNELIQSENALRIHVTAGPHDTQSHRRQTKERIKCRIKDDYAQGHKRGGFDGTNRDLVDTRYDARIDIYNACADMTIENTGNIQQTTATAVEQIMAYLERMGVARL